MIVLAAVAACGLGVRPAAADPPLGSPLMGGPPMGHRHREDSPAMLLGLMLKHADLTADQQTQVRKIMDDDHQRLHALFNQLHAANTQLAAKLVAPGAVQLADLQPQVQQIAQLRQQLMEQGIKTALAIRAVLTPAQLAKVAAVRDRLDALQTEMRTLLDGPP